MPSKNFVKKNLESAKVEKNIEGYHFAKRYTLRDEVLDFIIGAKPIVLEF